MEVNASLLNFAAGQLSKKFLGRVDLAKFYKAGALLCRNFIPQAQGPAEYRPGSRYVLHTRLNGATSLYPFVFNDSQAYALAFSDQKLRFFSDGGVVLSSSGSITREFLSHFDGADAATTYDAESGQTLTFTGAGTELDTAQQKFGASSLLLTGGTGKYVTSPTPKATNIGTSDFTLECWVRFNALSGNTSLISMGNTSDLMMSYDHSATKLTLYIKGTTVTGSWTPLVNTWYHVAATRESGTVRLFADGVLLNTVVVATKIDSGSIGVVMGGDASGSGLKSLDGWIDEVSIQTDAAEYTAAFTPPVSAYASSNLKAITGITQADPGVVTVEAHGYSGGEEIHISQVAGMTELNGNYYLVVYIDADTFSLTDVDGNAIDTTAYTAYTSGGLADAIYEIDSPYLAADVADLQVAQKADLMYIVHPDYAPRKLTRAGDANWTLTTYIRTSDPFTKTITGITQANPGVVTSNTHGFSDGDIVQLEDVVGMVEVNENQYAVANSAANTFELTDAETGTNVDTSGFTAYSSAGVAFVAGNMPGATAFFGGRHFFGGTDDDPETFWGSRAPTNAGAARYDDHTVGANADDAVTFPISSQNNMADRIQWFAGVSRFLGIGTFGGVYKANGGSDNEPISGTAIDVKPVEFVGCRALPPVRIGSALFYVQRGGLILNNFSFSIMADDFKAMSVNVFSDEITATGLKQLAVQQGLADIIWSVTTEGKLLGLTVQVGEEINAWHSHELGGTGVYVRSVCGEPQPNNQDDLWMVAERTINGNTRRYMEYFTADPVLPEPEDYYTGVSATDDTTYRALLYEKAKELVRVDSALTLDTSQLVELTPGATTGTGVTFTAGDDVFVASDVGRRIVKKFVTGQETGIAVITGYTSATVVTCTIETDFDSVSAIASGNWYLTATTITGLDHLEGETVRAQVEGQDDGTDYTVTDGAITLSSGSTVTHVGLKYTGQVTTMPLDIGALVGTAQAKIMTINRLGLLFRHSRGTKYGTDLYRLETLIERDTGEVAGRPPKLITETRFLNVPDGYDRRKFVHIVQDTANPCTIQAIIPFVDTTNE